MMYSVRKKMISRITSDIISKSNIKRAPIEIEEIAKLYNIEVKKHPYKDDSDLSAILIRENDRVIIGVNDKHHEHRQRFSIAHELGHFFLHEGDKVFIEREYKVNFRNNTSSMGIDNREIEANAFASLLLMPETFLQKDLINYDIDMFGEYSKIEKLTKELAEKYNVSQASMMLRLSSKLPLLQNF